jgi:hypothetical protein
VALAASLLVIVCAQLPWLQVVAFAHFVGTVSTHVGGRDVHGLTDLGDGNVTAIMGAIATLVLLLRLSSPRQSSPPGVRFTGATVASLGFAVLAIAAFDSVLNGPNDEFSGHLIYAPEVTEMYGLWLTGVFGALMAAAGLQLLFVRSLERRPARMRADG